LKGDAILVEARILAVADVVEAMASHRPYRPSLGVEAALQEIDERRGILYDEEVVNVCLRLFREKRFQFDFEYRSPWRPLQSKG
jgi:HD-GYP domain-containing protein (c-di-GMP phosphodiesterase class II)